VPAPSTAPLLTQRTLNRALLARQGLLERRDVPPLQVVEQLVGLQAQEPIDPYVALWSRIADFEPMALSDAIDTRQAVRIGLMRTTLHLVSTADALALAPATEDVLRRAFRSTSFAKALAGQDPAPIIEAARAALEERPMTPTDLGRHLATRWPDRDPQSLSLLARYHLPLVQVPPRGLWRKTGRATNTTLEAWTGDVPAAMPVEDLLLRYLRAFGPATVGDMRVWSWLTGLRAVVERLRPRLRTFRDERGRELFDVEDGLLVDEDVPAPVRFLPQYDNIFLSHEDRSRISGVLTWGLDFAWKGPIIVDGGITAAWRVRREKRAATMTVELGRTLTPRERRDVQAEAERLSMFLDPDTTREVVVVPLG
jgi:Winged helix DNA-binding domain